MKPSIIGLTTLLLITLTLALAASNFISADAFTNSTTSGVMIQQQPTPTSTPIMDTDIGSTDGILVMGVVIILIVTIPVLFRKK